jgi:hypothetical protein
MKKYLSLMLSLCISTCYAIGPNELIFDNTKFIKRTEKTQNHTVSAEYTPIDKNSSASITIMHVMGKNDPYKLANGLRHKKSIEVLEIDNVKEDRSDLLVSFIKFDMDNLKVQNNLCRIQRNPDNKSSVVFQYIDTKKLKSQTEGMVPFDYARITENVKQLPIDKYLTSLSQTKRPDEQMERHIPWYQRPYANRNMYGRPIYGNPNMYRNSHYRNTNMYRNSDRNHYRQDSNRYQNPNENRQAPRYSF